ncbi:hypothetical protein C8Q79DRAFT_1000775 [Trametes meyenii]|nr:hypothetical protein C8Q79DRAFT_1000775 [Trametes meyenii]
MSGSDSPITSSRHNDFVGSDASKGRISGADKAVTGHHFIAVDIPRDQKRPQEHLSPSTGRDQPPVGGVSPGTRVGPPRTLESDILSAYHAYDRSASPPRRIHNDVQPLPPAPESRTVIDKDPYATPATAADTLTGATSQDVHGGYGHPGSGMTSAELHHDGQAHRKRPMRGTDQFGAGEIPR